ncbi:MAG: sigma-54 dependent transcriptional regulator [Alphaproteobacteria bacterium]
MVNDYRVLVIDDDRGLRDSLCDLLESGGFDVEALPRASGVLEKLASYGPDVILCDVRMPGVTGIELLEMLQGKTSVPMVLMSTHGDISMAVSAMQDGAYSFVEKPFDPRHLLKLLEDAATLYRLSRDSERLKARLADLTGLDRVLLGATKNIVSLREEILDLSESDANVMLRGETGSGKELVARALHDLGARAGGPFVPINCAAIPLMTFEETLFGSPDMPDGLLAQADGGTLFLDELGAIPTEAQAALLRVIETRHYTPVGSTQVRQSGFRVVSAGNEKLEDALKAGALREDFFFRLNIVVLTIPALRERRDDIPLLYANFLDQFAVIYEITSPGITSDDLATLLAHPWPGNVRELRSVAERRILAARRGVGSVASALQLDSGDDDVPDTLREAVAGFERQLIARALTTHQGRMDAVAEALGIGRRTLNEKIVKLGLNKDEVLKGEA